MGRFGSADEMLVFDRNELGEEKWHELIHQIQVACDPFLNGTAGSGNVRDLAEELGSEMDSFRTVDIEGTALIISSELRDELMSTFSVMPVFPE